MAIQYSGNAQTSTFTPSTKQNIIDTVGAALLAAGWTTASGGTGTTNWMLTSATTPQGYAINVRMKDNAGTCVTFSIESTDGVLVGGNSTTVGGGFLNPAAGTYRIVCSKYQAFIFVTPNAGTSRSVVGFGVPYVPAWVASSTTRVGWISGNAISDTDTTVRFTFRTALWQATGTFQAEQIIYNGTIWTSNASVGSLFGSIAIPDLVAPVATTAGTGYRWSGNNAAFLYDALLMFSGISSTTEAKGMGLLWDAIVASDAYAGDTTSTFDSHNWICLTDSNSTTAQRGTLLIATS